MIAQLNAIASIHSTCLSGRAIAIVAIVVVVVVGLEEKILWQVAERFDNALLLALVLLCGLSVGELLLNKNKLKVQRVQ